MARLIDADALEQEIIKEYYTANNPSGILNRKGEEIFNAAIDVARCRVRDADVIDAVPVVHGRWEYNPGDNIPYCNRCGMPQDVPTNYCHDCGAKMDGGVSDE